MKNLNKQDLSYGIGFIPTTESQAHENILFKNVLDIYLCIHGKWFS